MYWNENLKKLNMNFTSGQMRRWVDLHPLSLEEQRRINLSHFSDVTHIVVSGIIMQFHLHFQYKIYNVSIVFINRFSEIIATR